MGSDPVTRAALYRRTVRTGLTRIWENVLDWEHLPWLHRSTFSDIKLLAEGREGWRARVGLQPAGNGTEMIVDVELDRSNLRYVTRTVEGPGAGTEIWTTLHPEGDEATRIEVAFLVPGLEPEQVEGVGAAYTRLYARLWDEDEGMMIRRDRLLRSRGANRVTRPEPLDLGPLDGVRERLPLLVEMGGRSFRVLEVGGELAAHSTLCPHLLGPLEDAALEEGAVRCPWHGYRFDPRSGRSCDGRRLRLEAAPRVEIVEERVRLVWPERRRNR